jgi:hypothetical protein
MKTSTVLQFADLADLCFYLRGTHASSYRIDTSKLTVKIRLTPFEAAVAMDQYKAVVVEQWETVS